MISCFTRMNAALFCEQGRAIVVVRLELLFTVFYYDIHITTRRERLKSALYLRLKKLRVFALKTRMPRMYSRHPKCAFHARYDWKITFPDWKQKKLKFFLKKIF